MTDNFKKEEEEEKKTRKKREPPPKKNNRTHSENLSVQFLLELDELFFLLHFGEKTVLNNEMGEKRQADWLAGKQTKGVWRVGGVCVLGRGGGWGC